MPEDGSPAPICVVVNNVRSLFNVGSIFRACDAVRAERLYLTGFTGYPSLGASDPRPPYIRERADREIRKTALRTVDHVRWEYRADPRETVRQLRAAGKQIVALELTPTSKPFTDVTYRFPVAVLLGHEREGVAEELLAQADVRAEIPMYGHGTSLNVANAFGILAYELVRQWRSRR